MVKEVKRDFYEERQERDRALTVTMVPTKGLLTAECILCCTQTVWVFANGDIQPRRATVLEETLKTRRF